MPKIQIGDIQMYYEIHGDGEPLVLAAGFGVDHLSWSTVLNAFAHKYRVLVFDNRGAGQTDAPLDEYSIPQMADDLAELCQQLHFTPAHFIGSSMGGYIIQTLAKNHPDYVRSLTISNSAMGSAACFGLFLQAQIELLTVSAPIDALIKASLAWLYSPQFLIQTGKVKELIQESKNAPFPFTPIGFQGQLSALTQFNSSHWAQHIQAATLVIGADCDLIIPPVTTQALANKIPNAQYYVFKNCGHLPHIEYPELFFTTIHHFHTQLSIP